MRIDPLGTVMAAEISDVDLAALLDTKVRQAIKRAMTEYLVLCFRDQTLEPAAFVDAARIFGSPKRFLLRQDRIEGVPEVSIVSNRPPSFGGKPMVQAKHWHTDDSYLTEPATVTLLQAKILPGSGGDTEFINAYAALNSMPRALRCKIQGLRAVHRYESRRTVSRVAVRSAVELAETPEVDHPLVRTHPESGSQTLYINPNRIDHILGWDETASDALLGEIYAHALQPQFQYRHVWRPGDIVVWDNRCTLHRANADYDLSQPRIMHRVMLEGQIPV